MLPPNIWDDNDEYEDALVFINNMEVDYGERDVELTIAGWA